MTNTLIGALALFLADSAADPPEREYAQLTALCFGEPGFVAVGDPGLIYHSPDGVNWLRVHKKPSMSLNTVVYAHGRYLAGGLKNIRTELAPPFSWVTTIGDAALLSSTDGMIWQNVNFPSTNAIRAITHGDPGFIAIVSGQL